MTNSGVEGQPGFEAKDVSEARFISAVSFANPSALTEKLAYEGAPELPKVFSQLLTDAM